jgi:hypothetical protein
MVLNVGGTASAGVVNNNPGFIRVFSANVENLPKAAEVCPGDWQDLIYVMKTQAYSPDLYLVQQIGGRSQLNELVDRMTDELVGVYAGVVAVANPVAQGSPCGSEKAYQTTAIIYRTGRFDVVRTDTWQSDTQKANGSCSNNDQSRTMGISAYLYDKVAGRYITAASFHWATSGQNGPPCSVENINEVHNQLTQSGYGGSLRIAGGDANVRDRTASGTFQSWYNRANGDRGGALGYRDVVYHRCMSLVLATCLDTQWTFGGDRRIDFLFAKRASGMPSLANAGTISFDAGDAADNAVTGTDREDLSYSDHRATMADIYY